MSKQPIKEILEEEPENRYVLFPIKYPKIWEAYKQQVACFWTAEEIDLTKDLNDWEKLNKNEKHFIKNVLAFFAGSDGIVLENLIERFMNDVKIPEARCAYSFQGMIENIHCVTGDTQILTKKGYYNIEELENKFVDIWNGKQFSNVQVKYTGNSEIFQVTLDNGMILKCTDGHKWIIRTGNQKHPESCKNMKVETKDLKINDVISKYELPVVDIENPDEFKNPYIHGFFCGDGSYSNNYPVLTLYDKKIELLEYFEVDTYQDEKKSKNRIRFYLTNKINKKKFFVPINYSIKTKLKWLEGYVDADGCISYNQKKDATSIQVSSINYHFLKEIQLMMTTLGINTQIKLFKKNAKQLLPKNDGSGEYDYYYCKDCYILYIKCKDVNKLIKMGFSPKRLNIKYCERIEKSNSHERLLRIQKIEKISDDEKTYCFNEPLEHNGIFNGILTGQSETYSLLIDTYIKDKDEKNKLFNAIDTIPCVAKKAKWALKWIGDKESSFATRLLAFACVEGIFFSGSFCAIYWLKQRGLMPGLTFSNELISRDEGMHCDFACLLYSMIKNRLDEKDVHKIVKEAMEMEKEFIIDSLPCALIGMNSKKMVQYLEYVADRLVVKLGYNKIYKSENPFPFMELISLNSKANFFEKRNGNYRIANVGNKQEENKITFDDDDDDF